MLPCLPLGAEPSPHSSCTTAEDRSSCLGELSLGTGHPLDGIHLDSQSFAQVDDEMRGVTFGVVVRSLGENTRIVLGLPTVGVPRRLLLVKNPLLVVVVVEVHLRVFSDQLFEVHRMPLCRCVLTGTACGSNLGVFFGLRMVTSLPCLRA